MKRRQFLETSALGCALAIGKPASLLAAPDPAKHLPASPKEFELEEFTITELQAGMQSGKYTARSLVKKYLDRMDEIDKDGPKLNSVIEVNPDAMSIAEALDRERKQKGARGPLHGIPILIKDNIDTADRMMTTAGSLA
ncbi:MAG: amidase family protein, partial [bacterium]